LNVGLVDPDDMSLPKLVRFSRYLQQNGLQAREYTFNFWKRLFQPLASIVMIFLAIPFVLGAMRTSSLGLRMVVGVLVGFGFFIMNAMLGQLCVVYQMPTLLAALIPPIIFGVFSIGLSRKLVKY
jgi:lipopolysaccharide export system permease protein